jgi:hypothetical protein
MYTLVLVLAEARRCRVPIQEGTIVATAAATTTTITEGIATTVPTPRDVVAVVEVPVLGSRGGRLDAVGVPLLVLQVPSMEYQPRRLEIILTKKTAREATKQVAELEVL